MLTKLFLQAMEKELQAEACPGLFSLGADSILRGETIISAQKMSAPLKHNSALGA